MILSSAPLLAVPAWGQALSEPIPTAAPLVHRVAPSVVNISTEGRRATQANPLMDDPMFRRFFGIPEGRTPDTETFHAAGSGVIVNADQGYILTNAHVVSDADRITATLLDGRELTATLVGSDPEADIAVLKVKSDSLTAIPLGNSDRLEVGDYVLAVGNPFGLGQSVTAGIVSGKGRSGLGIEGYEDFIQTDAPINPGNSGGALVDMRGELVGINTALVGPNGGNVGIGFAIPINMVRDLMEQLIEHGEVRHSRLGVLVQDLTPAVANAMHADVKQGAIVARVEPGSPAETAGIKVGDMIVRVDGVAVRDASDLRNKIGLRDPGTAARIEFVRQGKYMTKMVSLDASETGALRGDRIDDRLAGAEFTTKPAGEGQTRGILVRSVDGGSPLFRDGLRQGDVITSVNGEAVRTLDEFQRVVQATHDTLLLHVIRGDAALFITVMDR